jgi:RNA 3'-terminal phosphate cyclase (ATP)
VRIEPPVRLSPVHLPQRGKVLARTAVARVANLPRHIAERELDTVRAMLGWSREWLRVEQVREARGPGNVLLLEIESEGITELFSGFGQRGVRAERVAESVVGEVKDYLSSGAAVGAHLADQLLVPMALAGGGSFHTAAPTPHTLTNVEVVRTFLDLPVELTQQDRTSWRVRVG